MIIVEGWIKLAEGEISKVRDAIVKVVDETKKEPGCLHYEMAQCFSDPNVVRITERWENEEALQSHFAQTHMVEFAKLLDIVTREGSDVRAYSAEEVRRLM